MHSILISDLYGTVGHFVPANFRSLSNPQSRRDEQHTNYFLRLIGSVIRGAVNGVPK